MPPEEDETRDWYGGLLFLYMHVSWRSESYAHSDCRTHMHGNAIQMQNLHDHRYMGSMICMTKKKAAQDESTSFLKDETLLRHC